MTMKVNTINILLKQISIYYIASPSWAFSILRDVKTFLFHSQSCQIFQIEMFHFHTSSIWRITQDMNSIQTTHHLLPEIQSSKNNWYKLKRLIIPQDMHYLCLPWSLLMMRIVKLKKKVLLTTNESKESLANMATLARLNKTLF